MNADEFRLAEYRFSPAIEAALIASFRRGYYTDAELLVVPELLVWGDDGLSTLAKYLGQTIIDRDEARARAKKLEQELDCGQETICAKPPGCRRHWEERNRELIHDRAALIAAMGPTGTPPLPEVTRDETTESGAHPNAGTEVDQ